MAPLNWACLLASAVAFAPQTKAELQTAVDSWCADAAAAEVTYGPISGWDTQWITDMSYLFMDKTTCNPNISGWDVGRVRTMS